ncbi:MAG: ABC transporter ATP-binding protein [Chloroflexi bacterium]|nr:ABC transporter ATP-binding protein [Chloroflexota bacterium]
MAVDGVLLQTRSLCRRFGGVAALSNVDVEAQRGEILAVIGPNGAGKTTLLNVISGVLPPTAGQVAFGGRQIAGLPPHRVAALGMARTFQNLQLFAQMTVLENVLVAREAKGRSGLLSAALRLPGSRAEEGQLRREAWSILTSMGLEERAPFLASALPFGQQRLLEIARALATEPLLLLLDEPAAGLSAAERDDRVHVIRGIRDRGTTIFLVEHDMGLVMELADRVVVLDNGEKIADAPPARVQSDARVIAAYLGGEDT